MREPLLEQNYSQFFDTSCSKYPHYLDTVLDGLEVIKVEYDEWEKGEYKANFVSFYSSSTQSAINVSCIYTALEEDLFVPKVYYAKKKMAFLLLDLYPQ